jgi:predicted DNA-binding protein YlxM (UPF0122 family)
MRTFSDKPSRGKSSAIKLLVFNPKRKCASCYAAGRARVFRRKTSSAFASFERIKTQVDSKQWQIFDLYVLKEWSVREVAKALNVSAGRVYLAKHRVSALLKKEVERLEILAQLRDR